MNDSGHAPRPGMGDQMLADIGEIKGLLRGVSDMMRSQHESTNRRIDDLQAANAIQHQSTSKRLDEMMTAIAHRMDSHESDLREIEVKTDDAMKLATDTAARFETQMTRMDRRAEVHGGATGAVIAAGIELAKHFLLH